MSLPWIPGAIRAALAADAAFVALVPLARIVFKAPPDVTTPWATIQTPGNFSVSGDGVAWSPLVQVDGWCPADNTNPYETSWRIAAEAARVLGRLRNITYQTMSYSVRRLTDGPLPTRDTSRGEANPFYGAMVRAELAVHTT